MNVADEIAYPMIMAEEPEQRWWLSFGGGLERLYRCEEAATQAKSVATNWLIGLALYDLFLINDFLTAGPGFFFYVLAKLGVCSPICLLLVVMIRKGGTNFDAFASAVPVVASATSSALLVFCQGNFQPDDLFGNILLMVCGVTVSRARLPWAAASVALQCFWFETVLHTSHAVGLDSTLLSTLYCLSAAAIALVTSASVERNGRHAFLLRRRVSRLNTELEAMAFRDPLTGLGNRRCFETAVSRLWAAEDGLPKQVSFILLDVDCFKLFNDSYGHPAGDLCLQAIARCVRFNTRQESDLVIRFGGEELVVCMPDTDLHAALITAERIRRAIAQEGIAHLALGACGVVTASLGVASALTSACTSQQLVSRADRALYEAKNKGRNRVWPQPIAAIEVELAN